MFASMVAFSLTSCAMEITDTPEIEEEEIGVTTAALGATVNIANVTADAFLSIGSTLAVFEVFSGEFCPADSQTKVRTAQLSNGAILSHDVGCGSLGTAASVSAAFVSENENNDIIAASTNTNIANTNGDAKGPMLIDSTNVYWADNTGIRKAPRAGGATTTIVSGSTLELRAIDGSRLWFVQKTDCCTYTLRRVQTDGSSNTAVHGTITGSLVGYQDLSVGGDDFLYWVSNDASPRKINRLSKNATWSDVQSTVVSSTTDTFQFPKANADNLYYVQNNGASHRIRRRTSAGVLSDQKTGLPEVLGMRLGSVDLFWVQDGATFGLRRANLP